MIIRRRGRCAGAPPTRLDDHELGPCAGLEVDEAEEDGGVGAAGQLGHVEATRVRSERLGDLLLDGVELHGALRGAAGRRGRLDPDDHEPLGVGAGRVGDDLRARKVCCTVKDLHGSRVAVGGPVEGRVSSHKSDRVGGDPRPVLDYLSVRELETLDLFLELEIVHLERSASCEGTKTKKEA